MFNTASQSMTTNTPKKVTKIVTKIAKVEAWKTNNPAEWDWMEQAAKANEQKAGTFMFPANMIDALNTYGGLTDGQLAAVQKLTKRDAEYQAKKAAGELESKPCDATKIETAFAKAAEYAYREGQKGIWKKPLKLRSDEPNAMDLYFRPGSKGSTWEGMIFVTDAEKNKLGHIKSGQFKPRLECTAVQTAAIVDVCQDPHKAANAYCKAWSCCGVCGRTLTNDESIGFGIGPICREKMGW